MNNIIDEETMLTKYGACKHFRELRQYRNDRPVRIALCGKCLYRQSV